MLLHIMWVPLMLLTALPDTSSACPLLILQQPNPVELGEEVLMNCTTSHDGYRSIYWSNGTKVEGSTSYVELSIPHIDLDTKAKCTIKLNDTHECSKDIQLNVYNVVQLNETAQENNQHEFKCDIPEVASVQNLTVTWYRRSEIMKTSFYNNSASAKTHVDSSLVKNVNREDNGTIITCEVLMELEQGHVFVSNKTWNLSVQNVETFDNLTNLNNTDAVSSQTEATSNETKETVTPATPEASGCPVTITPSKLIVQNNKPASANCSTTKDHDGMGWEATINGISLTQNVTYLEWKVEKVDWSITANCFINLKNGPQCEEALDIIVYNFTDKIQVSPVGSDQLVEGEPHELKCEFFNVAPLEKLQVKWYLEDELIHTEMSNGSAIFALTPKKEHNKANFKCEIELLLVQNPKEGQNPKVVSAPFTANVQYKPSIQDCPANYAGKEDELKLDTVPCKANGNPQPVIYWYYKDKPVNSTKALTRNDSGTYTGIFKNNIGNTSTTVTVTIEYGPLFTCKDLYNVTENAQAGSPCEPEGLPKPKSVWFKDEKQVDFPKVWKRQDGGQYLIWSSNKHGQANHTLSVNVLYAPSLSEDITQEFHMGENLTLNCSADGNPLPQLRWKYPQAAAVNTITRGRQIYITEATSTNAGGYICSATNEIGSVTRTVTLIMKGKTHIDYYVIIIFVILALLLGIFVSVLIYRNYKKKSGHYDVIAMSDSVPLTSR